MNRFINDLQKRTKRLELSTTEPVILTIYHEDEGGERIVHYKAIINRNKTC